MNPIIEHKLRQAKIKLFREEELVYFGILSYKFNLNIYDFNNDELEAYIEFSNKNSSDVVNNIINLNERFLLKPDYTVDNLIAAISHEIIHILERHGLRQKERQTKYWTMAAEHCTDRALKKINSVKPYLNIYNMIENIENIMPNCSAEQLYEWLLNNDSKFEIKETQVDESTTSYHIKEKATNNEWITNNNIGGVDCNESPQSIKNLSAQENINQLKAQASAIFENLKSQKTPGTESGGLVEYLNKLLKVEIPWHTLLEKSIKRNVIRKVEKRKWKSPNKKFGSIGIMLPGKSPGMGNKREYGELYICIDSSGSISNSDLKKFLYIVMKSINYFDHIKLFIHDTKITDIKEFKQKDIKEFENYVSNNGIDGRGGTSHRYVFDKIQELWDNDNTVKNMLSLVILLTDGDSNIEDIYMNYSWIKNNIPIVIILPQNSKFKLDNNIGDFSIININ